MVVTTGRAQPGRVASFDDPRGIGVVAGGDGNEYPFHCTAILDGTRTIEVGAQVTFMVTPRPLGTWEATAISE